MGMVNWIKVQLTSYQSLKEIDNSHDMLEALDAASDDTHGSLLSQVGWSGKALLRSTLAMWLCAF